jgi:predicted AAA+ superfamily ATPase
MYTRLLEKRLSVAMQDTRVVLLSGPRQAGKTTLAKQVASHAMPFLTLDDVATLAAARPGSRSDR